MADDHVSQTYVLNILFKACELELGEANASRLEMKLNFDSKLKESKKAAN